MKTIETQRLSMPALGLGTWQLTGRDCARAVRTALELGYRHVDTAQMYENEDEIGRSLRESGVAREEIFLTTKLGMENLSPERVQKSTEASLRRLRTEVLDLLLIHWPAEFPPLEETLDAMMELQDEGKVQEIGVSNFPPSWLDRAVRYAPVVCNQVEYHPFLGQEPLKALAREQDLALVAYSPLARGRVARDGTLREIGERHGKTPAQVTIRWLLQQDRTGAIPKATSRRHLEENLSVFDFELSGEEVQAIDRLARGERIIDPSFAPDWEV